jgi:hypothetical protein
MLDKVLENMSESISQLITANRSSSYQQVAPQGKFFKN